MRIACGNPSVRELERATQRLGDPYPRSTINDKLNGLSLPSWEFVSTFLAACARLGADRAPRIDVDEWHESYRRMMSQLHSPGGDTVAGGLRRPLTTTEVHRYQVGGTGRRIGIVTGDIRRVRCAEIWVNPENTTMRMARVEEFSVSAIIRYDGSVRDGLGEVVDDLVADELDREVSGHRPVPAGAVIVTGAGELVHRNGVSHIIHVAAVQGEPGVGYRQIRDVGRCLVNALTEADRINAVPRPTTILFPLLGSGQGGGAAESTATALITAATDYLMNTPGTHMTDVYFLAYSDVELAACQAACVANGLTRTEGGTVAPSQGNPPET